MGVSLSWVAVSGLPAETVLSRLALAPTGRTCAYPFEGIATHPLPGDAVLLMASRCDHRIASKARLQALSDGCQVVACVVEEHVNFASAELWQDGVCIWHVQHEGEQDTENISHEGQTPQRFHDLLATVQAADSDSLDGHFHMDIPLILAKDLSGYRHDDINAELDATPFQELAEL